MLFKKKKKREGLISYRFGPFMGLCRPGTKAASAAALEILQAHAQPISARPFIPYESQGPFHLLGVIPVIK